MSTNPDIQIVATSRAAEPGGHYSQATVHNGTVYVSGQLGIDPESAEVVVGSIEEQTEQALNNTAEILKAAGSDLSRVLRVTVHVSDIRHWDRVNAAYAKVFGDHRPARAAIPCRELHHGFQVEIDAIAAV